MVLVLTATDKCCGISTVAVSGTGKATAVPDIATFSVTYTQTRPTTKEAATAVNRLINAALQVLANNGVQKRDIRTGQISINPEYNYPNGTQTLKGQRASQTLDVKLRNITSNGSSVGRVVDDLSAINGSEITGVNFDISNKKPLQAQARRLAYIDARNKAIQYSQLSSLALGVPLSINEGSSGNIGPRPFYSYAADAKMSGGAQVPVG